MPRSAELFGGLTTKQNRFCVAMLTADPEDAGNASRAYRKAYNAKGMNDETVHKEAWALMRNPKIARRLRELEEQSMVDDIVDRGWVRRKLSEAALVDDHNGTSVKALELLGKSIAPDSGGSMFVDRQIETVLEAPEIDIVPAVNALSPRAARVLAEDLGQDYDAVMAKFHESHGAP